MGDAPFLRTAALPRGARPSARRGPRVARALSLGLLALLGLPAPLARAADPVDDGAVLGPEFEGLPDTDAHSGLFLDLIASGASSLALPARFTVVTGQSTGSLRVAIFDGNAAGLWDQNRIENGPSGDPLPDGSVVEYDLWTDVPGREPALVALGESESAAPRPGARVFANATDGRWELLYDGPHHPAALLPTGEHAYRLQVGYRVPTPSGGGVSPMNGYKVAANGRLAQDPGPGGTLLAGYVGGVVDSRTLLFDRGDGPRPLSVSRDHYPDVLEPDATLTARMLNGPAYAPAVRFPAPDPFVNRYTGTFDVAVRLVPPLGTTWADYVRTLVLEEGDADDADDASGIGPDGLPSPSDPGMPPDDGRPYVDEQGNARDASGYRLPVSPVPRADGSPWLEVIDPRGVVRVVLLDLSGNVSQADGTEGRFEKIPVPEDGVAGDWILRMHGLDARNSWFLRASTETRPVYARSIEGRVYLDGNCDGDDEGGVDGGLSGVPVTARRTDVAGVPPLLATTDGEGRWRLDVVLAGTYAISVDPGAAALAGLTSLRAQPVLVEVRADQSARGVDFPYCAPPPCVPGPAGLLHDVTLEASVWVADPAAARFDVYVRLDADCDSGSMLDLVDFSYAGTFPGPQAGRSGLATVEDVKVVDGYAKVRVRLVAAPPAFPLGAFAGSPRVEVVVNGVGEAACDRLDANVLRLGGTVPHDWRPLWCGDVPDFLVRAWTPWDCWEGRPCTDGCVRPLSYWAAVNARGACAATRIPWPIAGAEDAPLGRRTWLEWLSLPGRRDARSLLAQQVIVATLNAAGGACTPATVRDALEEARELLDRGTGPWARGLPEGRAAFLANLLAAYSRGAAGPPACPGPVPKCPPLRCGRGR